MDNDSSKALGPSDEAALAPLGNAIPPQLAAEIEAARSYRARSKAANTVRAYDSDWRQFEEWCWVRDLEPMPAMPEAVATYLASLAQAGRADSTIGRHLAAIAWHHKQAGQVAPQHRDPLDVIGDTLAGIRREQRARPTRKKSAILAADLARMIAAAEGQSPRAIRDRAVMALGLAAALRRIGLRVAADDTWSDMLSRVLGERVEPHLGMGRVTILDEYPAAEAALARKHPGDGRVAERFEVYACGVELANGFGELTNPEEQRRRFQAEMDEKQRIYGERYPIDESFLAALSFMPEASGIALGFDRLVMLATAAPRIDDVIWAPVG